MKIGIVVPFSWSFWGAVVEHAELQAAALEDLGHDVRLVMGNDPPGQFTRVLHPRVGRHGNPPPTVIPVGRSVIVPANGSLPNIVLSPRSFFRITRALERERFDVIHLHEPMTPTICLTALIRARCPIVATFHASGDLGWMKYGGPLWGFMIDRIDHRIAVSERARESQNRWLPGEYEVIPNGVLVPDSAPAGDREHRIVFAGRQEPRKGLQVLLRAWPDIHRRTGLRLTVAGADPLAVRLLLSRLRVSDEGLDVVGFLSQDELTTTLLRVEGARGAVDRPGELRHGADACVRVRAAGRRIRHPRIPRGADIGCGAGGRAERPGRARGRCVRSGRGRRTARAHGRGRARAGGRELLVADDRAAPGDRVRERDWRPREGPSGMSFVRRVWRSGWTQVVVALVALVLAFAAIWWRGPDWGSVLEAFRLVIWSWIVLAFLLNVVSTLFRALSWRLTIRQALPDEHQPRIDHVLSAFGVGLLANAVVPGRLGELARVATLRRHLPDAPPGTSATLIGTVFAHRLFDLVPATILVVWVLLTAEVPHWAVVSFGIAALVGFALFTVAWLGAKRNQRPVMSEGMGSIRQLVVMGRQGLAVLKEPVPLAGAILLQCCGWLMQLLAVYVAMQAFNIDAPLPAAGLVLVLMNIATIVPLWPGNVGLVQAAVALPLRNYGVAYPVGFAYGIVLQAIEMACGISLGLIAIAREGISFAVLRRMEDEEQSAENALEEVHEMIEDIEHETEPEAAREGAAVSR